jgi:signal transduction histidine kinase
MMLARQSPSHSDPSDSSAAHLLATVGHELRNPLAALGLSLDLLIEDFENLDPAQALEMLRRARRNACWLQTLTEDLSSSAALELGEQPVRPRAVDLAECVEQACALVAPLLEQRSQRVRVELPRGGRAWARGDGQRIVQVLVNLLANACRYSVEGDEIELRISRTSQGSLCVRVTDHGPGVAPGEQQRIFERFVRGTAAESGARGLGLGLNIVRRLVELHGGQVGLESTPGVGASFWFTLPALGPAPIKLRTYRGRRARRLPVSGAAAGSRLLRMLLPEPQRDALA